jgi:hypothetical protein
VTRRRKLWPVLLVSVSILAILVLSAAFHDLELSHVGRPLPHFEKAEYTPPEMPEAEGTNFWFYLFIVLSVLSILLMLVLIVQGILSPETRKRTLRNLALVFCLLVVILLANRPDDPLEQFTGERARELPLEDVATAGSAEEAPSPAFDFTVDPPPWTVWGLAYLLALFLAGGMVAAAWFVWQYTHRPPDSLEQLAQEAQGALDALRAGADPKDTVLRCYLEMSRVLRKQRGIVRKQAMTAREFERSLGQAGLPDQQVQRLTRLFEGVRYGARMPEEREKSQAIECLTAIVEACGSPS